MQRCLPGKPVLVDASQENALALAGSLDAAARAHSEGIGQPLGARVSGLRR
jgi:hypothetical protein